MRNLSDRQQKILEYIRGFLSRKDYPPSIRDIQLGCKISSTSVVDYNLKALERLGFIRRDREVSRAIELLDPATGRGRPRAITVPLVGQIAAGQPIPVLDASVNYEDTVEVTADLTQGRESVFALRVKGQSMIDALVNDGDIVLIEPAPSVRDGEMVAAWLKREEETTLKKIYREGPRVRLQPANTTMEPIYTEADNVEVQGRVISVIRPMA